MQSGSSGMAYTALLLNPFFMWQLPKGFHSWDEFNIVIIEAFIIAALVLIGIIKHTNKDK